MDTHAFSRQILRQSIDLPTFNKSLTRKKSILRNFLPINQWLYWAWLNPLSKDWLETHSSCLRHRGPNEARQGQQDKYARAGLTRRYTRPTVLCAEKRRVVVQVWQTKACWCRHHLSNAHVQLRDFHKAKFRSIRLARINSFYMVPLRGHIS